MKNFFIPNHIRGQNPSLTWIYTFLTFLSFFAGGFSPSLAGDRGSSLTSLEAAPDPIIQRAQWVMTQYSQPFNVVHHLNPLQEESLILVADLESAKRARISVGLHSYNPLIMSLFIYYTKVKSSLSSCAKSHPLTFTYKRVDIDYEEAYNKAEEFYIIPNAALIKLYNAQPSKKTQINTLNPSDELSAIEPTWENELVPYFRERHIHSSKGLKGCMAGGPSVERKKPCNTFALKSSIPEVGGKSFF